MTVYNIQKELFDAEKPQSSNGQGAPVLVKEELVVTRHIDAVGNELAPVELGEKAPKVLKGYNTDFNI